MPSSSPPCRLRSRREREREARREAIVAAAEGFVVETGIQWSVRGQHLDPDSESFVEYRRCVGVVTQLGIDATRLGQQSLRAIAGPNAELPND